MTSLNDENLPQLQQEVQRLLGRCMLRLQQYERLIKALVAQRRLSGPVHDLERTQTQRINSTAQKTLGSLVGELLGSYVVADEIGVRRQSFSESYGCFAMEALVRFLFEFRRPRLGAASGVFGLSVS